MHITASDALARTLLLTQLHRLRGATEDDLVRGFAGTTVCLVADEPNLTSLAAQSAVTTLVGLVVACGMRVKLIMPGVNVVGHQPPLTGAVLTTALIDLAADSVPGADASVCRTTSDRDLVFVVGDTPWEGDARAAWRLGADAWRGELLPVRSEGVRMAADFPLGALAAATIAAAEPYRAALRSVAATTHCEVVNPAFLEPASAASVRLAAEGTPTGGFDVGRFDMVSGGAITAAALHALLRVPHLSAQVRVWEPQVLEPSNLNRYVLMRRSMCGVRKIDMVERWQADRVAIAGFQELVSDKTVGSIVPWARWVFVGTDNVETRWLVQETWPQHLVIGGTAGFMAMVSEHEPGRPCARCLHRATESVAADVPTVSFVSYLAGLLSAARLLCWAARGPAALDEQVTEAWADRLDSELGFRCFSVQRAPHCPIGCSRRRRAAYHELESRGL